MNTLRQLVESDLTIGVHNRHIRLFNRSLDEYSYNLLKNRIKILNDKKIGEIITKRQFQYAVLLRKLDLLIISRDVSNMENGRPLFRILPECPFPGSIVYGLRYGSPYLNKLNSILHHLNQGGILQHWAKSEEFKNQNPYNPDNNKELKSLTLGNLQELFIVWAIGLTVSTIVFLIEILYNVKHRINTIQNIETTLT